ncbi:MAG: GNAT family N-acetyltransferase [Flavobacteriaceae bacterium]|nr:GNAT family N-acetyltransferase [Flavobacteriaceae bacterium]
MFSLSLYNSSLKSQWDNFINESKNGTFLFNRNFIEYHKNRFKDYSILFYKQDKLIAVLPANKLDDKIYSHQGLTYGGLILSKQIKFSDVTEVFNLLLSHLHETNYSTLIIKEIPEIYKSLPSGEVNYLLHRMKAKLIRRDVLSVIKLGNNSFSRDRIQGNKRGKKNKLTIKETSSFEEFWNTLLIPNLKNKHNVAPVHSLEEITTLNEFFPKKIRQFNVYSDDKIVAGTTIFETKTTAHVQYISANEEKNKLGSLDYLFTYLIEEVFNKKDYFDFGISNENNGEFVNQGLLYWKEGFGARSITQDFYEIHTKNYTGLRDLMI